MSKFIGIIIGGLEVIAGIALYFVPGYRSLGSQLINAGTGSLLSATGTLLSGGQDIVGGLRTASRNAVAPHEIVYGRTVVGGTLHFPGQD